MTRRLFSLLAAASLLTGACSSDNPMGPEPTIDVTLDLCSSLGFSFSWIGVQTEGRGWQQVTPGQDGMLAFKATEKLSIAFAASFFGSSFTQVLNTTATELNSSADVGCPGGFGTRSLSGTVTGLTGEQRAQITAGFSATEAYPTSPTWNLSELPSLVDLVALRFTGADSPDRIIIRRGLAPTATPLAVPAIDFAAAESHAVESHPVTLANLASGFVLLGVELLVTDGGSHSLGYSSAFQPPYTLTAAGVPAALRLPTDMHAMHASSSGLNGVRDITHYYRTPAAKTLTFGPFVSPPSIAELATSPYRRLRALVPSQAEYPSAVSVDFFQSVGEFSSKVVGIMTTVAHLGGQRPATWDLSIPDFGNSGYQASWGLSAGAYEWSVTAHNGSADVLFGGGQADGATLTSATRFSDGGFALARSSRPTRSLPLARRGLPRR